MRATTITFCVAAVLGFSFANQCPPDWFTCDNGLCAHMDWVCDGCNDCGDNSDEPGNAEDCPPCKDGQWQCNNGRCIANENVCDGRDDCRDASDEQQNCQPCGDEKHQCKNGVCVYANLICDGYDHCGDGSDERDENGKCPECPPATFVCLNGDRCVQKEYTCDGDDDCWDGSDETEDACPCADNELRCSNREGEEDGPPGDCIPPEWICDEEGIWDCPNGDDEANCTIHNTVKINRPKIHRVQTFKMKEKTWTKNEPKCFKKTLLGQQ